MHGLRGPAGWCAIAITVVLLTAGCVSAPTGPGEKAKSSPEASFASSPESRSPWRGLWPQDSRGEAERAQLVADSGDARYQWQIKSDGGKVARGYAREELSWAKVPSLGVTVSDEAERSLRRWRLIRCVRGAANPDYERVDCAPFKNRTYPAVSITVERLLPRANNGLWFVTKVARSTLRQRKPPSKEVIRRFVAAFLERRIRGSGAKEYLSPEGKEKYGANGSLGPLYGYGRAGGLPYDQYRLAFVHGPAWPSGSFEVGVRIFSKSGRVIDEETLFVGPGFDLSGRFRRLLVGGSRSGLTGP